MTEDELEAVVVKLKENYPGKKYHGTNWEFLIELWNNSNPRYAVDPELEMPEYDFDTISRYEEK